MDKDINQWLEFVREVETSLPRLESAMISDNYKNGIFDLLKKIRIEAGLNEALSADEKRESYLRINKLGSELKSVAYFAS